jgi:cyclohexyl-isocyanide hydratase
MRTRRIGILVFPDVEELDFVGPLELLSFPNKPVREGRGDGADSPAVEVFTVAESLEPIRCGNGLRILPEATLNSVSPPDVLILPGGNGRKVAMKSPEIRAFLRRQAESGRILASVCTGAFLLAEAGLLEGLEATTFRGALDELRAYPGIRVAERKVIPQGRILTSGGVSSGLDLAMVLLGLLFDPATARAAAAYAEYRPDPETEAILDSLAVEDASVSQKVFPGPISALPEADLPFPGARATLLQGEDCQALFMVFPEGADLPEHAHAWQWGLVLEGRIDLEIDGVRRSYVRGDRYFIPEGVRHSGRIHGGYADVTLFGRRDRYVAKSAGSTGGRAPIGDPSGSGGPSEG